MATSRAVPAGLRLRVRRLTFTTPAFRAASALTGTSAPVGPLDSYGILPRCSCSRGNTRAQRCGVLARLMPRTIRGKAAVERTRHPHRCRNAAVERGPGLDKCLLAGMQLPVGGDDLPERQPPAERTVEYRAREASAPRPLGREPGAVFRVGAPEPNDRQARPRHALRGRTRPRGTGRVGAGVSRRDVLRNLSGQE